MKKKATKSRQQYNEKKDDKYPRLVKECENIVAEIQQLHEELYQILDRKKAICRRRELLIQNFDDKIDECEKAALADPEIRDRYLELLRQKGVSSIHDIGEKTHSR
jgi:CRISPR/Cas system CSM-associated protein Csm2 small subunit